MSPEQQQKQLTPPRKTQLEELSSPHPPQSTINTPTKPKIEHFNQARIELKIAQDNANLLRDVIKTLFESPQSQTSSSSLETQQQLLQDLLNSCKESKKIISMWVVELSDKLQSSSTATASPSSPDVNGASKGSDEGVGQTRSNPLQKLFSELVQVNESLQEVLSLHNKYHQQHLRQQQQESTQREQAIKRQSKEETEIEFISDDIPEIEGLSLQDSWKSQLRQTLGLREQESESNKQENDRRLPWETDEA